MYYHYCDGELESVTALFAAEGCCGNEDEDEDSDCCQNEIKIISQKSENNLTAFYYKVIAPVTDLNLLDSSFDTELKIDSFTADFASLNFQPPETGRSILTSKSVLII